MKTRVLVWFLAVVCLLSNGRADPVEPDKYDLVRLKWRENLVGPPSFTLTTARTTQLQTLALAVASNGSSRNTTTGTGHWDRMDTSPSRTTLWPDLDPETESADITATYSRLKAMALAYGSYGGAMFGNTSLRDDIIAGLDWMNTNCYGGLNARVSGYNWWDYEIGAPLSLNDITIIMFDDLNPTQKSNYMAAVEKYKTSKVYTGANLTWTKKVAGLRGLIVKVDSRVEGMKTAVNTVLAYKELGSVSDPESDPDGFYQEGSFLQHRYFAYSGGYGLAAIIDIFDLIYLLKGSEWEVNGTNTANAFTALYNTFEPQIFRGEMMDMMRGREVSRYDSPSHKAGRKAVGAFIRAAQTASAADASHYKSLVKHWLQVDNTLGSTYAGLTLSQIIVAESIVADGAVTPQPETPGFLVYPVMDRAVKVGSGWAAGLSMHSTRIKNFEVFPTENFKGYNHGFGMLYIYNGDLQQFSENYWPTVDPFRLPGTTTERGRANSANQSGANFVGGVEALDLQRGVSVMDLAPAGSNTIRGKKAWFFLDNEIICLGAGITAPYNANRSVETIVENRKLNTAGDNVFLVNGVSSVTAFATTTNLTSVTNAHLSGNVSGSDIGYYFPGGVNLSAVREQRSGAWTALNTSPSRIDYTTVFTNRYLALYYNHGNGPTAGSYSYAVLPNFTASQVQSYSANPQYEVLENSTAAQAVKDTVSAAIGAVFWQAATKTVGSGTEAITSSGKAATFVSFGSTIDVVISDPTKLNTGVIELEIARPASSVIAADASITVTQLTPTIKFSFNANQSYGLTKTVRFAISAAVSDVTAYAGDGRVLLAWPAVSGAVSYNVKRGTVPGGPYTTIATGQTANAYTDSGVSNGSACYYVVTWINASNVESTPSGEVSIVPTTATLIADNADASGVTIAGSWVATTASTGYYGSNYLHDYNAGGTGGKSVTYAPSVATAGYYDVYVRWTAATNRATNVPVDVITTEATTTYTVNQTATGSAWVLLGRHLFKNGDSVRVRNDGTNGYVVADAVRLILR
ncbi:polysaccharide lyase family 8 super-sandwich domain-containing protein [Oleiharenicola lentus]|uniref:polysaccharide lyase family 8 super-sandwich domain-containing protein n=1 Tax=Oleiharenicola lentus TaxID=2508720 RepID=UPI003F66E983